MSKQAYDRIQKLRSQLDSDPEYQELERRRMEAEPAFTAAINMLYPKQREDVLEFLGILQEQGLREIEIACFDTGK